MGYELVVANAAKVPLIGSNQRKKDQTDAYLLARRGRADVELRRLSIDARVKLVNAARGLGRTMRCPVPAAKPMTSPASGVRTRAMARVRRR